MRFPLAVLLAVLPLWPQNPAPARRELPPDAKAANEALNTDRPAAERLELMKKFFAEFPTSNRTGMVRTQMAGVAVEVYKKDAAGLRTFLDAQAKPLKPQDAATFLTSAVEAMQKAGAHPAMARRYGNDALRLNGNERPAARARVPEALGQIEVKEGKDKKGAALLKQALGVNPSASTAALALARMAVKAGNKEEALQYSAQALLAKPGTESRKLFADSFLTARGVEGADAYLDQQYRKLFPPPAHVERYQPTAARSKRVVLAEVHTGAGCPPCVAADLAFDAAMESHTRSELAVLMYHQHIPRPDPLTNFDTQARWRFQQGQGVPTFIIDGKKDMGGGARDYTGEVLKKIESAINADLEKPPGASLQVQARRTGDLVTAQARVDAIQGAPHRDLQLRIVLAEKEVSYSGENGIRFHPMVVRGEISYAVAGTGETGHTFDVAQVQARAKEHIEAFEKHDDRHNKDGSFRFAQYRWQIDPAHLAVVAFVEDAGSKEILQAAYTDVADGKEQ